MKLKGSVRTRRHPEGSICEAYKFDESLTFCSNFLKGCETGQVGNVKVWTVKFVLHDSSKAQGKL